MSGTWLLPTRGRIHNLRRFLNAAREMGTDTPGLVLVNRPELEAHADEYASAMKLFPSWECVAVDAESYGDAIRAVWDRIKGMDWVGLASDDLVPAVSLWDKQLVGAIKGWNVVSSNDGWQARPNIAESRMHGATVWSGDVLRAVGWLFPPKLRHIFHDDIWETIGRNTSCWQVRMDIMVKHLHEALEGVRGPTVDPNSDLWKHDQAVFQAWVGADAPRCLAAVQEVMQRHGVVAMRPDFTGVSLMIGTPSVDGKYESTFMTSLWKTFDMLKASGVPTQFAEEKYTADIALARDNIFSAFVRSNATHLLMIDADMGWDLDAVIRLFCARKDFVAIAGPKKRYPIQFAANHTDPEGNPIPLEFDTGTGTMEVSEVGSAFALVTREMALRMVGAYPELEHKNLSGEQSWAVFNPMVVEGRFFSEDFAFCKRWRLIGGKVFIVPDVRLKHTGFHTFEAAFIEPGRLLEAAQ